LSVAAPGGLGIGVAFDGASGLLEMGNCGLGMNGMLRVLVRGTIHDVDFIAMNAWKDT